MVATFLGNDFHDCVWKKDIAVVDGILANERSVRAFIKRNFHLYRLAGSLYHQIGLRGERGAPLQDLYDPSAWTEQAVLARALPVYRRLFARIANLAGGVGSSLLVAIIPTEETAQAAQSGYSAASPSLVHQLPGEKAREVFEELRISIVETLKPLAAEETSIIFLQFDGHLTREGHRIVADTIARGLEAQR